MTLRVYIAGSSKELERAEKAAEMIREIPGIEIVSQWVQCIQDVGASNPKAKEWQRRKWADGDLLRVARSDLFWALLPTTPTAGLWFEWGYARRKLIRVIASGGERYQSIFTSLADWHVESDDQVPGALRGLLEKGVM